MHRFLATIGRSSKRTTEAALGRTRRGAGLHRPVRHRSARVLRRGGRDHGAQPQRRRSRGARRRMARALRRPLHHPHPARVGRTGAGHHRPAGPPGRHRGVDAAGAGRLPGPPLRRPAAAPGDGRRAERRDPPGQRGPAVGARSPLTAGPPRGVDGVLPRPVRLHPAGHDRARPTGGRSAGRRLRPAHSHEPGPARRAPGASQGHAAHRPGAPTAAGLGLLRALRGRHHQPAADRVP